MPQQQIDAGALGGLLKIIVSIATIIALYTGMTWYVFHIYFGQVMTKLAVFDQYIADSNAWKFDHSKETGKFEQKISDIDKRVNMLEAVVRIDKNSIIR